MSVRGGDRLTPLMARIRDFFLIRKYNNALRYAENYSRRSVPPAFLPEGVHHKISENYYYNRDTRRQSFPSVDVYSSGPKLITRGGASTLSTSASNSATVAPGKKYDWDSPIQS
ncbi:NADH:ubiquinone oxidoreductase subunit B14.5a domain-containing protein [Fasciolopsis buskii]|uniref:NADH dehydrogenase [ubiquinone] 1 alpha subcomplex subunit 7 n=1 Tax=Fasciolopsis buskii TaxID=27845 RepID=A0A8E0RR11_9TREM|nr:NADH:ubiquinone oxidoreductase subunit B14.5a domain-containing protein [Fasciolopsis buski]